MQIFPACSRPSANARTNETSPYTLDFAEGEFVIRENGEIAGRKIYFAGKPGWCEMRTEGGFQMGAIAQEQASSMPQ